MRATAKVKDECGRANLEAAHELRHDDLALGLREPVRDAEQHEHILRAAHAHCVQVAQHIRARDPTLQEDTH